MSCVNQIMGYPLGMSTKNTTQTETINREMLAALRAFVTQANKVAGFPLAYEPYIGALVAARAAIEKATGGAL